VCALTSLRRNTQLIIQEETGVTATADPFAGSYMMEALTDELETKATALIDEIDAMGGMTKAIEAGWPARKIEETAARRQAGIDSRRETIVGVNKYVARDVASLEVLKIDNVTVRSKQIARLTQLRASRDGDEAASALTALRHAAASTATGADRPNLLALAIDAARARCTTGEISAALEDVFGRYRATPTVTPGACACVRACVLCRRLNVQRKGRTALRMPTSAPTSWRRCAAPCSSLAWRTDARLASSSPRQARTVTRAVCACVVVRMLRGDDRAIAGANVVATAFAELGFDVDIGPLFATPQEVRARAVVGSLAADTWCRVSSDRW
jgi:methylmalonyl-CoA mutase